MPVRRSSGASRPRCPRSGRRKRYPARSYRTRHGRSRKIAGRPLPGVAAAAPAASGDCRVIQPALHALLGAERQQMAVRPHCASALCVRPSRLPMGRRRIRVGRRSPHRKAHLRHRGISGFHRVSNTQRGTPRSPGSRPSPPRYERPVAFRLCADRCGLESVERAVRSCPMQRPGTWRALSARPRGAVPAAPAGAPGSPAGPRGHADHSPSPGPAAGRAAPSPGWRRLAARWTSGTRHAAVALSRSATGSTWTGGPRAAARY